MREQMGTNHYAIRAHLFFNVTTTLLGSAFCGMKEYHSGWGGKEVVGGMARRNTTREETFGGGAKELVSPANGGSSLANGYRDGSVNAGPMSGPPEVRVNGGRQKAAGGCQHTCTDYEGRTGVKRLGLWESALAEKERGGGNYGGAFLGLSDLKPAPGAAAGFIAPSLSRSAPQFHL